MRNWLEKFAYKTKVVKPEHSFYNEDRNFEQDIRHLTPEEREQRIIEREKEKKTLFEMTAANFDDELAKHEDTIVLIHVYSHKGGVHKEWGTITRKLQGLVKVFEVNPSLDENKDLMAREFMGLQPPFIAMYPSGDKTRRHKKRKLFSKEASFAKVGLSLQDCWIHIRLGGRQYKQS